MKEGKKEGSQIYDTSHVGRIKELISGTTLNGVQILKF